MAEFGGLSIDTVGTGYSLQVASGGLTATVQGLAVAPGPAANLAVTEEPPLATPAGGTFGLAVWAEDAFGNLATTFTGTVTVAVNTGPASGPLNGLTTISARQGVVSFTGLSLDNAGAGYRLIVAGSGLNPTLTGDFSITPGPAARLAVAISPPDSVAAGSGFGLVVVAQDTYGNVATSYSGAVTIALATDPDAGVLYGMTTVAAHAGVAAFSGLTIDTAASGYVLQARTNGLSSASTGPISVTPTATELEVLTQPPASVVAGTGFGLTIAVADASGNLVATFDGNVTIALAANPGGGELSGELTVTAVNGVATFTGLSINVASAGYTLQATSSGLTAATTSAVTVGVGPVPHLQIFDNPGPIIAGSPFEVTVDVEDSTGATEMDFAGTVTVVLARNPTGAILGGTLMMNAALGQATFYGLTVNVPGSGYTILATCDGFVAATTSLITVVTPPATQLVVTGQPPASVGANAGFGLAVEAVDADGELVSSFDGPVTVRLAGKSAGAKLLGSLTVTATDGVARFSGLSLTKARHDYTLQITSSGLAPTSTRGFDVSPTAAQRALVSRRAAPRQAQSRHGWHGKRYAASGWAAVVT